MSGVKYLFFVNRYIPFAYLSLGVMGEYAEYFPLFLAIDLFKSMSQIAMQV